MQNDTYPEDVYRPRNFYIGICVALLFLAVGVYFFFFHFLPETQRYIAFKQAIEVPVTLVHNVDLDCDEDACNVEVQYQYNFEGTRYVSKFASIYRTGDNFGSFQQNLYARIKDFKENEGGLNCFVHRDAPGEAVIDRSFRWSRCAVTILFFSAFGGIGCYLIIYMLWNRRLYFEEHNKML